MEGDLTTPSSPIRNSGCTTPCYSWARWGCCCVMRRRGSGHQSHPGGIDQNKNLPKFNVGGQERSSYNFRGNQSHLGGVDPNQQQPRFDIGGQVGSLENHRPRFIEIVPPAKFPFGREARYDEIVPPVKFPFGKEARFDEIVPPAKFPFGKEARYDEISYGNGGARRKDRAAQDKREQVSHFKRQEAPTQEQWATIESVKQSIGPGTATHHY